MKTYLALLRGVNVAGQKPVAMADLRDWLGRLGFRDARSLLQSGNLSFRSAPRSVTALEALLEAEAVKGVGLRTDFFVRTPEDWQEIINRNPFADAAKSDPGHLVVMFLKDAPAPANVKALQSAVTGPEIVRAGDKHLYITYPAGIGRSRLTNVLVDRKLATRGTGRNWNTVLKMAALATPSS